MSTFVSPSRVCIIADDLTGAADAAVAFAARGASARVLVDGYSSSETAVRAVCTATREVSREHARSTIGTIQQRLQMAHGEQVFKKIDSVFRGNTLAEIANFIEAFPQRLVVIAPAYPAVGRQCVDGLLRVEDVSGYRALPLRQLFRDSGLAPRWIAPGIGLSKLRDEMDVAVLSKSRAIFCEATTGDHIRTVVEATVDCGHPVLWVGSGGLAHALAEVYFPSTYRTSPKPSPGCLTVFNGSEHYVSHRQIERLQAVHMVDKTLADDIRVHEVHFEPDPFDYGETLACLPGTFTGSVMLNGGDTALYVCRALGVTSIDLVGEFEAGVPIGIARGGKLDGITVILKSGGFGDTELLVRIAIECSGKKGRNCEAASA